MDYVIGIIVFQRFCPTHSYLGCNGNRTDLNPNLIPKFNVYNNIIVLIHGKI